MELTRVAGQPSWHVASDRVEAWLTETGGHLGPVTFDLDGRKIEPFSIAPWVEEELDPSLPPVIRILRGDFFCMPFGANTTPFGEELHPAHGETCNEKWQLESLSEGGVETSIHTSLSTKTRTGRVDKHITLKRGQTVMYQRHVISGMSGPMSFGHHPMLRFPDIEGCGLISTSPFVLGRTPPEPVELPENQGYSILKPNTSFESLEAVETITGELADLSRYPARRGYEDLVMLVSDPNLEFTWTAVSFPDEGYVWFTLKNPRVLRQTVFWISNMGRYHHPWDGRHLNVMGLEEVISYFHYGLAESVADNPISRAGYPTCAELDPGNPLDVRYILGVAAIGREFGKVSDILPASSAGDVVELIGSSGESVHVALELDFLHPSRT